MNDSAAQPFRYSPRLRVVHAFCAALALVSVFFTGIAALKSTPYDGITVTAHAGFTVAFAHVALFLSRKVYAPDQNSGRLLTFFALLTGYLAS